MGWKEPAAGIAAVCAAGLWLRKCWRSRRKPPAGWERSGMTVFERVMADFPIPGVRTYTFFEGDVDLEHLRERIRRICHANPWLFSRIVRAAEYEVWFDPVVPVAAVEKVLQHVPDLRVDPSAPVQDIHTATRPWVLDRSTSQVEADAPLFRVTVFGGVGGYMLMPEVSHLVADGHTYYRICEMLSTDAEVTALDPHRPAEANAKMVTAVGEKKGMFAMQPNFLTVLGFVMGPLKGPWNTGEFTVRREWIEEQKKAHDPAATGVPFVSTNDVLTAWFFSTCRLSYGQTTINFRNRNGVATDQMAGNYEMPTGLHAADFTPHRVRETLMHPPRYHVLPDEPPGAADSLQAKFGFVTNWCQLQKRLKLPGSREIVHIPGFEQRRYDLGFSTMVVWSPRPDDVAVLWFTRDSAAHERLLASPALHLAIPRLAGDRR